MEQKNRKNMPPRPRPKKEFEEVVVNISRVTKVNKGGRTFRLSATVVVGDRKGRVGLGTGKAPEVPDAVAKAIANATKNVVRVPVINGTLTHEVLGVNGAGKVLLKPAKLGTGVKAGGAVRAVLEMAGITDVLSKSLGSNTKLNVARATMKALESQKTPEQIAALRGKTVEEIVG